MREPKARLIDFDRNYAIGFCIQENCVAVVIVYDFTLGSAGPSEDGEPNFVQLTLGRTILEREESVRRQFCTHGLDIPQKISRMTI
eukprot:gene12882-15131_t